MSVEYLSSVFLVVFLCVTILLAMVEMTNPGFLRLPKLPKRKPRARFRIRISTDGVYYVLERRDGWKWEYVHLNRDFYDLQGRIAALTTFVTQKYDDRGYRI